MAQCHTVSQHVLAVFANGCQCFCYNPTVARLLLLFLLLLLLNRVWKNLVRNRIHVKASGHLRFQSRI